LFKNKIKNAISILDIGAMLEGKPRYYNLLDEKNIQLTGFEPNESERDKFLIHYQNNQNTTCLPYALGDGKRKTLYLTRYPGCSSLFEPDKKTIDLFNSIGASKGGNFEVIEKKEIQTRKLDDVLKTQAHYIKLDIQGAELMVLKHAKNTLKSTLIIETEAEFIPIYKNQPLFGDLQVYLKDQGFVLHKLIDVGGRCFRPFNLNQNPFASMSQLLWADAIFVKDFTKLEHYSDEELLILALILDRVYYSYDLVFYLLNEYDKRNKTVFTQNYQINALNKDTLPLLYMNTKDFI
jgi:FkbM family methyltransferase